MDLKDYQEKSLTRLGDFLRAARTDGSAEAFAAHAHPTPRPCWCLSTEPCATDGQDLPSLRGVPYVAIRIPPGAARP